MTSTGYWKNIGSTFLATPVGSRFVRGALWSVAGSSVSRGLTLIASIVTARILGQAIFGQLGVIQSTVGTLGTFAGLGLGMTATKYVASERFTDRVRTGRILALLSLLSYVTAAVASFALIVYSPILAAQTLKEPQLAVPLQLGAVLMFLSVVNGVQTGALAGFESFRSISRVNIISGICSFPLIIIGSMLYSLNGTVAGLAGSMALNCWLNHRILYENCREHNITYEFRECFKEKGILINFTFPSALSSFIVAPVMWYANILLVNQPNGYLQMGLFNAAQQWQTAIMFLPTALSPLILSLLANTRSMQNNRAYWHIVKISLFVNAGIVTIASVPLCIGSPYIMRAYGTTFESGWSLLCLLLFSTVLNASLNVIGQIIASSASMWWGFILNSCWAIAFLCSASTLVKSYGAIGLGFAYLISYLLHLVLTSYYSYKKISFA